MAERSGDGEAAAAFRNVTKRFGAVVAAQGLSLSIGQGEFLSLLGPSGCGKTTALRMLAGFEQPSEGEVRIGGAPVNGVPAHLRPVNMVFQHYALFPHLDVAGNIAYGLRQRRPRPDRAEIARRVDEALELVRLPGFGARRIWEMSGGQQQRVALARALVNRPSILLLDEPLAALDRKLRRDMQIELQNLQRTVGITFVLVTHDQEEALSMSDRVCVMRDGRIVQAGAPRALYDRPADRYVADFLGKTNFFEGQAQGAAVSLAGGIAAPAPGAAAFARGARVCLSVRPEQVAAARDPAGLPPGAAPALRARVENRIFLGEMTEYVLRSEALGRFLALAPRAQERGEPPFEPGETVHAGWLPEAAQVLAAD